MTVYSAAGKITTGTCSLSTGDVGLVDGGLQRREGCRRAPWRSVYSRKKKELCGSIRGIYMRRVQRWAGRNRRGESPALP
jgi:hypothetical protein